MPASTVRIVHNSFPKFAAAMPAAIRKLCSETATAIEQDIKGGGPNAAPIDTGNLRRSYHKEPIGDGFAVGNDPTVADYAIHVEYGTHKMRAQPHLRPATEAQRAPFKTRLVAILRGGGLR